VLIPMLLAWLDGRRWKRSTAEPARPSWAHDPVPSIGEVAISQVCTMTDRQIQAELDGIHLATVDDEAQWARPETT
jgi:hypothetical protein